MKRFKIIIQQLLTRAWSKRKRRHTFRVCAAGSQRVGKCFSLDIFSSERRCLFQLFRNIAYQLTVGFVFALTYVLSRKRKFVIYIRQSFACSFSTFFRIVPLCFHGFASISHRISGMLNQLSYSPVAGTPKNAQISETSLLTDIPKFDGIKDIHAFNGFHSFYNFLRQTLFHNRYVLVEDKGTIKKKTTVYNLSVSRDESYIIPISIVHNCRCNVVKVRKSKYAESNIREAIGKGNDATTGKHQEMFRFNPGKQQAAYPAYNSYTIGKCSTCSKGGFTLAKIPNNELCQACGIIREMKRNKEELKLQRATVKGWAKDNLIGKTVRVDSIEKTVEFTVSGIKEALNQPHRYIKDKNKAVKNIRKLLKEATYIRTDVDSKGREFVYHYLRTTIHDEDSYIVVRENTRNKLIDFYSIVEKIKEP